MTTNRSCAVVSIVAALIVTVAFGACAAGSSREASEMPTPVVGRPLSIRFDNGARDYVHVYLVGERRQWLLGRVEPGAVATLRIPDAMLTETSRYVRLAVITGEHVTPQAALNARATFTIPQPVSAVLWQRWAFSDGELLLQSTPRPR